PRRWRDAVTNARRSEKWFRSASPITRRRRSSPLPARDVSALVRPFRLLFAISWGWTTRTCRSLERDRVKSPGQRLDADVAEPDGLAFGLQRDVPKAELQRRARRQQGLRIVVARIQLRMLVAQDFHAIDAVDHLVIAMHLDLRRPPF